MKITPLFLLFIYSLTAPVRADVASGVWYYLCDLFVLLLSFYLFIAIDLREMKHTLAQLESNLAKKLRGTIKLHRSRSDRAFQSDPVSAKVSNHSSGRSSPGNYACINFSPQVVADKKTEYDKLKTWCTNNTAGGRYFRMVYPSAKRQVKIQLGPDTVLEFPHSSLSCRLARLCLTCASMGDVFDCGVVRTNFALLLRMPGEELEDTVSPVLTARINGFEQKEGPG